MIKPTTMKEFIDKPVTTEEAIAWAEKNVKK